jgi:hypothetical protein
MATSSCPFHFRASSYPPCRAAYTPRSVSTPNSAPSAPAMSPPSAPPTTLCSPFPPSPLETPSAASATAGLVAGAARVKSEGMGGGGRPGGPRLGVPGRPGSSPRPPLRGPRGLSAHAEPPPAPPLGVLAPPKPRPSGMGTGADGEALERGDSGGAPAPRPRCHCATSPPEDGRCAGVPPPPSSSTSSAPSAEFPPSAPARLTRLLAPTAASCTGPASPSARAGSSCAAATLLRSARVGRRG